jgi:AAA+ ATPase superfamily predicted ATPase
MYFDITPKECLEDFYNYRQEYSQVKKAIQRGTRIVVIKGVRRVGKTSLMRVIFRELDEIKVFLDGRKWRDGWELMDKALEVIHEEVNPHYKALKNLTSVALGPITVGISSSIPPEKVIDKELRQREREQ